MVMNAWPEYLEACILVMLRLSGLMIFAPLFSSAAIAPRIKAGFVIAMTILLAPSVALVPDANVNLTMSAILGELGIGLVFGLSLMLLSESLLFAGALLGMEFSFSLVNLMDPNSRIETPVLGQLLNWINLLVVIGVGLDRSLLAGLVRSFRSAPLGHAVVQGKTGAALAGMAGGIFLAGLQLAAPIIAAVTVVEVTVALVSKLSPHLPAMIVGIPLKTLVAYTVLIGSLALWPGWIERHFTALLDAGERLIVQA